MPQIFRIGAFEPVHVHVSEGRAVPNATKLWITSSGKALICNNNSKIPSKMLKNIVRHIEANSDLILDKWQEQFGELKYYC